jgi:hypothetical protein
MSAFASIKQGLQEAVAHSKGQPVAVYIVYQRLVSKPCAKPRASLKQS